MRKFIDIINESNSAHEEIAHFLHQLATDEVGVEEIAGFTVRFEGFSDMCWEDAEEKGKTSKSLVEEMLKDWQGRHPDLTLVAHGWTNGDEMWSDTIFYAVYRA